MSADATEFVESMMSGGGEFTRLEKRYGGFPRVPLELPKSLGDNTPSVEITWDTIDQATHVYAKTLQEYNIGEIMKAILKQMKKDKTIGMLPSAGNLDLKDVEVGFHEFIVELEKAKAIAAAAGKGKTSTVMGRPAIQSKLRAAAAPIVAYLLSGKHSKADKQFTGWKRGFTSNAKKSAIAGIVSIDLPQSAGEHLYVCGGTQHYIAFVYLKTTGELYLFDSATKNPIRDHTEVYYILKYTFEALFGEKSSAFIGIKRIPFKHVLQLGAGDRHTEDTRSYNNQNVFCHTWSMWFLTTFAIIYDGSTPERAEASIGMIAKLALPDEMLNLAMIKRFAFWLLPYIYEPEPDTKIVGKFPIRAYERALQRGEADRVKDILETYLKHKHPLMGLEYIFGYKNKTLISVAALATDQKLAMDIFNHSPHLS